MKMVWATFWAIFSTNSSGHPGPNERKYSFLSIDEFAVFFNLHKSLFFLCSSVARWFVFKPKIPTLVKFGGPWNRKFCYILLHVA
jgi:hypothetical protein